MRIALVGAYGAGKTTLANALTSILDVPRVQGSVMDRPLGVGHRTIIDCTHGELIQLATRRFVERVVNETSAADGFISDGSVLHEWIYTKVRVVAGSFPDRPVDLAAWPRPPAVSVYEEVIDQIGLLMREHVATRYDLLVHLPVEFALRDQTPPISEDFRIISDRLLIDALQADGIPFHLVTGSVEQRIRAVLDILRSGSDSS